MEETKSYSIEKLTETNYRSWSQVLESHLDDQDLWELVQGSNIKPEHPSTPTATQTTEVTQQTVVEKADLIERWRSGQRRRKGHGD